MKRLLTGLALSLVALAATVFTQTAPTVGITATTTPKPSPVGTVIPPALSFVDQQGHVWEKGPDGQLIVDGKPAGKGAAHELLLWSDGVYGHTPTPTIDWWFRWNGVNDWIQVKGDPRPGAPTTRTPTPAPVGGRNMVGGCIGHEEWSSGRIAIDFATNRLWVVGHDQVQNVHEYRLSDCTGTGDPSTWPVLQPVRTIPKFWPNIEGSGTYCGGLAFFRGKLWCSPKVMYAASPVQGSGSLTLYSPDGSTIDLPMARQKFSGFVKRAGQEPLIGGGGYASGQGSVSGPTLATMSGQVLLSYEWPPVPGANLQFWNQRAPRDPNYWVEGHVDSWVGWEPRVVKGVREGRWASDGIEGGGLLLPDGLKYWPLMGTGELKYSYQSIAFAAQGNVQTYEYTYDPKTYRFLSYRPAAMAWVKGQEVGPDGTVYLAQRWLRENYIAITVWR